MVSRRSIFLIHLLHHGDELGEGPVELAEQRVEVGSRLRRVARQVLLDAGLDHLRWTGSYRVYKMPMF